MIKAYMLLVAMFLAIIVFVSSNTLPAHMDEEQTFRSHQHSKSQVQQSSSYSKSDDSSTLSFLLSDLLTTSESYETAGKISYQYIVVLKANSSKTPTQAADEARDKGAQVLHVYDSALKGFAIEVPNDKVLEAITKNNPDIDYIEPNITAQAHDQNS
jgi:hypothetical protein